MDSMIGGIAMDARLDLFRAEVAPRLPFACEDWLAARGFFTAPASTIYHGSYAGGLFDHSLGVMRELAALTERNGLVWQRPESPYIVGFFHDICKADEFVAGPEGFALREDCLLRGHGDKSVMLLAQLTRLTEEETLCVRYHMGAFTPQEEWNDYTRAVRACPNVLWTHHADMLAAHVRGV